MAWRQPGDKPLYEPMVVSLLTHICVGLNELMHWGRDKMANISQTTFWNAFSWMKMCKFRLRFYWSLFLRVQLTICLHWFSQWVGAIQVTSHYLNQLWLVYWCIYASCDLNELTDKIQPISFPHRQDMECLCECVQYDITMTQSVNLFCKVNDTFKLDIQKIKLDIKKNDIYKFVVPSLHKLSTKMIFKFHITRTFTRTMHGDHGGTELFWAS